MFAYLAAFEHTAEWDPGCASATALQEGPPARGSRYALRFAMGPRTLQLTYEIVELEPPRALVLRGSSRELRSVDTIEVSPASSGEGSTVAYAAEVNLSGIAGLLDPLLQIGFQRVGGKARDGLAERLSQPL